MLVQARVIGRREEAEERSLPWPGAPTSPTAADLIDHVVRAEVADFAERQVERRLLRVLTEQAIAAGAAAGKVAAELREGTPPPDPQDAVTVAHEAFTDGIFLLFVDDVEVEGLDTPVTLHDDVRVRFVRMTALAGG